ncbi:E3 ubiquitin-protein ligase RNFT1 [Selaginella moellendorffii]|nr:E3 ubiquitin-protein ligase RNFT1 [Selaginella moellendorffii]XP_024528640.1 E3 ubiquitin-protein ligase RNFT1 [Selaginella moellendorffii]|eukprot:XP_002967604.2 E3 ubiquitin-protein ligase RNFT1 [Selaginella moellendorffii]
MDLGMDAHRSSSAVAGASGASSYGAQFLFNLNLFPRSLSTVLEVSGLIPGRSHSSSQLDSGSLVRSSGSSDRLVGGGGGGGSGEVAIRIIGEDEEIRIAPSSSSSSSSSRGLSGENGSSTSLVIGGGDEELGGSPRFNVGGEVAGGDPSSREAPAATTTTTQRYDFQPLARWLENVLPFTVLLLFVFIRQHLEGIAVTVGLTAVMIRANVVLRRQTALKGERKKLMTAAVGIVLVCHIVLVYSWYTSEAIWKPLLLLPPRKIPKFWEAIFTIVVNDVMVRQAGMAVKCVLLLTCKSTRGRHFRKQGQLLTAVEYLLLLVRALIPGPVWYRFFLNKEYGNVFSSLTTGLYLTFKLTSVFSKVREFIGAVGLVTRCEVQYGSAASSDEVLAAGDMCAICQEKMHSPISLRCKHIFCEDCVSEWFERERTCPLCRAVVKSANFRSFADGRTSLLPQIF